MYVTLFVICLIVAIMFHEFGHFATAKAFGMKVDKFFLGFGPTLWSVRRGETEYGVKAIPAGGFVRIVGMHAFEDIDPADQGRTFYEQAAWKRVIVLVAGSFTHFIVAAVLIFFGLVAVGVPVLSNAVALVTDDSPAAEAGLAEGDRIVAVNGQPMAGFEDVREAIAPLGGETATITLERAGTRREVTVDVAARTPDGREQGFLGVGPQPGVERYGIAEAAAGTVRGDFSVPRLTVLTVQGLGEVFSPEGLSRWFGQIGTDAPREADGPISVVGIGQAVGTLGASGDVFMVILILAQLNLVLGLLNMLPLPPLDGGHVATLAVEETVNGVRRLRGTPGRWRLDPAIITPIALLVIVGFTVLFITALYLDIAKPVTDVFQ
jgi:membrane-associated protease RseP (regulator of RpoE activity)